MRSIRLSLVVYFLLLLTAAVGSVCWLVYQTAAGALEERRRGSQDVVETQYVAHVEETRTALDRRLVRQAQTIAAMARSMNVHLEGLYPLGVMGAPLAFQGYLHMPLWLAEGTYPPLSMALIRRRSWEIDVEAAEDLVAPPPGEPAHEYFQVYSGKGLLLKRSKSLGGQVLELDAELLESAEPLHEYFDNVRLESGATARRVTLKTPVTRFHTSTFPMWIWRPNPGRGPIGAKKTVASSLPPSRPPPRPFVTEGEAPVIFVQYAIDTTPTEAQLRAFAAERDAQLARLDADTAAQLHALRHRLFWIAVLTFLGAAAGGYALLRLGLAPLARLSDAVSKVSERDFRLKLDHARLPAELQPIAERLSHTLGQLGKAFDREKQAAADISHELRTPLAALMTTVEVALRKARSGDEYREILEECRSSGRQMSLLVERLLALARLDAGAERFRPRPVDAADLALQCADLVRPLARARDLSLEANVTPPLPVETDPDKLREVLTNLLHNAVEYNRPGGRIALTVARDGGDLVVTVRDTGIGITAEARARIFERFYRADPSRHADSPHAGLGLAIVKSYVDLLGGTITVESVPGQGSTFRLRLPLREAAAQERLVPA